MSNIAIIPARGGSKRIPGKNTRLFCGKPIIAWSIEAALSSGVFDEVMVSTDDETIAAIAKQYGASVPFMRSAKNADDYATTIDVLKEVLQEYKTVNKEFGFGCCIYATAPFVSSKVLADAYKRFTENNYTSFFPVVQYSYPIWRSLKVENNKPEMWWPENMNKRSQDLPPAYHDAGQFYWFKANEIDNLPSLFTDNSGVVVVDEMQVQDIDNLQDWQLAEIKYKYLQQHNG